MKSVLIFTDSISQLVLTPETEQEKKVLEIFKAKTPVEIKVASFYKQSGPYGHQCDWSGVEFAESNGGFLKPYESTESVMFIVRNAEVEDDKAD
jgi:hypothetical protein